MKILLLSLNRLRTPYPVYPLGLDHVAGSLADRHEVRLVDLCPPARTTELPAAIRDFAPELVGLSLRNIDNTNAADSYSFVDEYREVVAQVRDATQAPIVLGGAGFTICPREFMEILDADCGLVGEGERLGELADRLEAGLDPAGLPGLVTRTSPPEAPAPWPGPFPRAAGAIADLSDEYLLHGGMLNLQTKRGCPYHCVYCTYPAIEGHALRRFPPRDVGATARRLQDAGARFLFVTDATFNCDPEHNVAIAEALQDAGLSIPWGAFFTPLPMPPGYWEALAASGLSHVEFGTETLADRTLIAYGKPFRVSEVFEAHEQALGAGLHVAHYFMPGGPGETHETLHESLVSAERLKGTVRFFFCGVRIYPGTPLYHRAMSEGQLEADKSLMEPVFYRAPGLGEAHVEDLVTRHARGRIDWVVGSGGKRTEKLLAMMYARGHIGPLWEKLVR